MGVGIIRIQQGFDSNILSEEDTKFNPQSPVPQMKRHRSYDQMSQGKYSKYQYLIALDDSSDSNHLIDLNKLYLNQSNES